MTNNSQRNISREEIERLNFEFVDPDEVPVPNFSSSTPKWKWLYEKLEMVVERDILRPFRVGPFLDKRHCNAGQTAVHNFKGREKIVAAGWDFATATTQDGGLYYFYVTPSKNGS